MDKSTFSVSQVTPSSASVKNLSLSFSNLEINYGAPNTNESTIASLMSLNKHEILFLITEEIGSQYLQQFMSLMDSTIVDRIFYALFIRVFEVMSDQFGRHVFAKLIKSCSHDQLQLITLKITSRDDLLFKASLNKHGSSSIKQLIRVISKSPPPQLIDLITSALKRLFKHMMITKSGLSILLHCLETLTNHQNDNIYLAALEDFDRVSCREQGCISMNNFIDEMSGTRRKQLLYLISINSASLSNDPYGNFVVQHVIELENPEFIELICFALKGQLVDLSMLKEGSHVVEKILKFENFIGHVVFDFLNSDRILQVANDRYGNYVIQKALKESLRVDRYLFQSLVMKLKQEDFDSLRFGYGKNVFKFITGCGVPIPQPGFF
ncbi:hypothetical protein Ddye_026318 [Dipteronia dyeriana]|uniref:PUM-HD domain-containing protein n=1 Tax=Dipteronia dyeriana TaxID=168575 RepID=A0AAD9WQD4_9ROSI|nr:hypothetical protein Ddye_026318 [Dipteronia dyeriana]